MNIVIVDCDMGNLHSTQKRFERNGKEITVFNDLKAIVKYRQTNNSEWFCTITSGSGLKDYINLFNKLTHQQNEVFAIYDNF
jgi:hypothetical protein